MKREVGDESNVVLPTHLFKLKRFTLVWINARPILFQILRSRVETPLEVFEVQIEHLERGSGLKLKNITN